MQQPVHFYSFLTLLVLFLSLPKSEIAINDEDTQIEIKTIHRSNPEIQFDLLREESRGTRQLFFMMLNILHIIDQNKILMIDEIEDSLHPKIVEYVIKIFHLSNRAQLLFSTHNTNLLDLSLFRKDQIWFVNKKEDASTDLYSLYDYSDFRDTMDLEKAYLQGRFDAVPIVNDSKYGITSIFDGEK